MAVAGAVVVTPRQSEAACGGFYAIGSCAIRIDDAPRLVPALDVPDEAESAQPTAPPARERPASRLDEIGPMLSRCLQMPSYDIARAGMRVTIRLAFTRDGEILGEPRFTFITPGVPSEVRAAYQRAVVDMLGRCTPLNITKELGGAIAGRPFVIPIVETRKEKKA